MPDNKEKLCPNCIHHQVCIHEKLFSKIQEEISSLSIDVSADQSNIRIRDIEWANVVLSCDHYRINKNIRTPEYTPLRGMGVVPYER